MRSLLVLLVLSSLAHGSPNVSPEDPRYDELAQRQARGELSLYQGGVGLLTEARIRELLEEPALPRGPWLRVDRAMLRTAFDRDRRRRYDTPVRPRHIAGGVAVTCEHQQGRPCIGSGVLGEVDGSAGYGDVVSGTLRLRANAGSQGYDPTVSIDRAYVLGEIGPVAVEVGRDILVVGPRSRTQLGWGDNAPPLDQVRLSTSRPFRFTDSFAGNAFYVVGRLRDPQTFPGNLVTISRLQGDIAGRVEFGVMQLLMLGGEGAAPIGGPIDFIAEHIRRRDLTASATDSSNRRFGGDVAVTLPFVRLYYQVVFEDIRKAYWHHAVLRDADHLLGAELAAIGPWSQHGLVVELHTTGVRSQEHTPRVTGLTNAGRVAGAPLGQDATSLYLGGRIQLCRGMLYPWLEIARLESDTYRFMEDGPIEPNMNGPAESRYRAGIRARIPVAHGISAEGEAIVEHVLRFGFEPGASRTNGRIAAGLIWEP